MGVEEEINLVREMLVYVLEHYVVDISTEVTNRCIEKMQIVLHTDLLELTACGRVELRAATAVKHIDIVNVFHKIDGLLLADILVERAAEIVGYIVFSIRKSTRTAKSGHNRAGLAFDTGFYLVAVDGTLAATEGIAGLKDRYLERGIKLCKLVCREDSTRAGTYYKHVVIHKLSPKFQSEMCVTNQLYHKWKDLSSVCAVI